MNWYTFNIEDEDEKEIIGYLKQNGIMFLQFNEMPGIIDSNLQVHFNTEPEYHLFLLTFGEKLHK